MLADLLSRPLIEIAHDLHEERVTARELIDAAGAPCLDRDAGVRLAWSTARSRSSRCPCAATPTAL